MKTEDRYLKFVLTREGQPLPEPTTRPMRDAVAA
jgi:hypothetical protein